MADTLELSISNDLPELARLAAAVGTFLEQRQVPPKAAYAVNLALEELVSNVIKYAHDDASGHAIDVAVAVESDGLVVRIEDDGRPFDPLEAPEPELDLPLEERKVGGLGIHLVRDLAGPIRYERRGNRNRLEVRISLD